MRELDYTAPGWPEAFYDYMLDMLVMPAPEGFPAEFLNERELKICAHPDAIMCRWFDVPTSPPEG